MLTTFSSMGSLITKNGGPSVPAGDGSVFLSTVTYAYTGADQTVSIPSTTTRAIIQCWGAGGSSRGNGGMGGYATYNAGGGGYTKASLLMTPADTVKVIVGAGGDTRVNFRNATPFPQLYGGGGEMGWNANDTNWSCSTGGGRAAVQKFGLITGGVYDDIICAGGGGGSGIYYNSGTGSGEGGFGGGTTGGSAGGNGGGQGGTQSAGGGAGASAGLNVGFPGSKYQGGSSGANEWGGGGGGGYYGGGSGGGMNGGGGGSSYIQSSLVADGGTASVNTQASSYLVANAGALPSGYTSSNVGSGGIAPGTGANTIGNFGKNGLVVISFYH